MAVLELDAEHRIGQQLHHLPAHLEQFFFGQAVHFLRSYKSRGALAAARRKWKQQRLRP
jgi:hypothetical protein